MSSEVENKTDESLLGKAYTDAMEMAFEKGIDAAIEVVNNHRNHGWYNTTECLENIMKELEKLKQNK